MRKRLLAIICLLTVFIGCLCVGSIANAATERYQVGYAIRDINPWVDPEDHSKGVLPVKLTGNGNDNLRVCTGIMDDNDNGIVDDGDGLFTTATAVTDPYGKTVIYITIDALQGYGNITTDARKAIVAALGSNVIVEDQIMVNANHSHSAPSFGSDRGHYDYALKQITDAAIEAYNDRAEAVMTKGAVDAQESTAHLGYNGGKGYYMNSVRHYDVSSSHKSLGWLGMKAEHVAGPSFGGMLTTMKNYKETSRTANMESDNTMHVLLFSFPVNAGKEPVVFVNWRAHSTTNSGGDNKTLVSSDFANSIRANLKKAGYRAAYIQGASGNVVTKNTEFADWTAECGNVANANVYGRILANVALDCIDRNMTNELSAGKIRTVQNTYHGAKQEDSAGLQAAAQAAAAATDIEYPYSYKHTDGKTYIINSQFHTNAINTRAKAPVSYTDLELNVIMLGDNVAFVTAPGELADRYDLAGSTKNEDNDWLELVNEKTYGTPFVMAYTNEGKGYIPFSLEYAYNTDEYYEITGKGHNGSEFHGAGSYEANTSRLARGTGEEIIQQYKQMLNGIDDLCHVSVCEACNKAVEWKPIIGAFAGQLDSGHYYMYNNLSSNYISLSAGDTLCLDLNGNKIETVGRCFSVSSGATLNLLDSVGTGTVVSYTAGSNVAGGTVTVDVDATFNIYGGTLQFIKRDVAANVHATGRGAVIQCAGTINMYGGTLVGGTLVKSSFWAATDKTNGCGGTVYLTGVFNAYGGRVISGKAAEGALGDCIYLASTDARIKLSGNAVIDEIFIYDNTGKQLTVEGEFNGKAAVRFNPDRNELKLGNDVGDHVAGSFTPENLYTTSHPEFQIGIVDDHLKLVKTFYVSSSASGEDTYSTLTSALEHYSAGCTIKLLKDVGETVVISQDTYIDLNGHNITGKIAVSYGKTLYCMDSQTDDYSVSDGVYGKVSKFSGNVVGVPVESNHTVDGYLMVLEDGAYSFHRVNLRLTEMILRPENVGIYYKSLFAADEVVARHVKQFGIAMSVLQIPNEDNMDTYCEYSYFDTFNAGENTSNTGTLLMNIMRQSNTAENNNLNAHMPIHGRAYIQLTDGTFLFGEAVSRNLRKQVEDVDRIWGSLTSAQKESAVAMYQTYADVMQTWTIRNMIVDATA